MDEAPVPGSYRERASILPGAFVWTAVTGSGPPARILPDGCIDLLWDGTELSVAGPDTYAKLHLAAPGSTMAGVPLGQLLAPAEGANRSTALPSGSSTTA